jgi:ubiquinol oxidase
MQEWNELKHLQIMEALGGDNAWIDRFIAQHSALVYYWFLVIFYALSPRAAYQFSELVEGHATDTYQGARRSYHAPCQTLDAPGF